VSALSILAAEAEEESGFHTPGLGLFEWKPLFEIGPVGVTKPMLMAVLCSIIEIGYEFVREQIGRPMLGKHTDQWLPLLIPLFFFIWIMNLMSVIPVLQFPVTSRIAYPAALALMIWLLFLGLGMKHQGVIGYFKNIMFPPGLPKGIYPLLAPIEFVSTIFVRPFTHAVRLFANMFAGHLLIALFSSAAYYFIIESPGLFSVVGVLGFVLTIVMTGFEMFIQGLQAYIFALLAAYYISTSLEAAH
jgi:F-type H+-transporting ATPase subunit a